MKTLNIFTRVILLVTAATIGTGAFALGPTIDSVTVQGYMKKNDGLAVPDGTYNFAYMVLQGGAVVWGKEYSTTVTSGLFSKTISGGGQDLTVGGAWANCTGEADFSGATLNSALLAGAGAGSTVIRVCSRDVVSGGVKPEFDITVAAAPTALVADVAYNVVDNSLLVSAFAAGEALDASAGAGSAGKVVLLDAGGLLDTTMLPTVPVANGGTGGTTQAGARTGIGAAASGANSDITSLTGLTTALSVDQGGTGSDLSAAAPGGVAYAAAGPVIDVTAAGTAGDVLTSGGAGAPTWTTSLPVANGGTGGTTAATARSGISAAASGANTDITSLTFGGASALGTYVENATCTMTIGGTTLAGSGTYTTNICRYSQIGKVVTLNWIVVTSAHTGTGNFQFSGLPVTPLNVASFQQFCQISTGATATTFAAGSGIKGLIQPGSTTVTVRNNPATNVAEAAVAIDGTASLYVHCNYLAN